MLDVRSASVMLAVSPSCKCFLGRWKLAWLFCGLNSRNFSTLLLYLQSDLQLHFQKARAHVILITRVSVPRGQHAPVIVQHFLCSVVGRSKV